MTETLTPQQQIERIKALLQTAKNPKQIRQYKALIRGLQEQIKPVEPVTPVAVSEPITPVEVTPDDAGEVVQQQQPETTQKKKNGHVGLRSPPLLRLSFFRIRSSWTGAGDLVVPPTSQGLCSP